MLEDHVSEAAAMLEDHAAFEPETISDDHALFAGTTTPFDATVRISSGDAQVSFLVSIRAPTLNAVVRGEEVAPVVQEGWLKTFERRVVDINGVTKGDIDPPDVSLDEASETVEVEARFATDRYAVGIADAKAIIDYVEGTYVQGIIPGYEYREPAAQLLNRAQDTAKHGQEP